METSERSWVAKAAGLRLGVYKGTSSQGGLGVCKGSQSPIERHFSTNDAVRTARNGLLVESTSPTAITHRFLHDALRRQTGVIDPRTGTSTTHYAASSEIDYTEDAAGYRTTYAYDAASRQIAITDPNTNTVERHYSPRGEMLSEWNATYPVRHEFDGYGQEIGLYTLRATNVTIASHADLLAHQAIMDKTTWLHHPATGLMTNKVHADGHGPTYTYTTDGKLHTRTWARGIVTTYGHATGTRELLTTDYSDDTPSVTNIFEQTTGLLKSTTDASGTRSYTHNDKLQILSEIHSGLLTNTLTRTYDTNGRPTGYTGDFAQTIVYDYDDLGRYKTVDSVSTNGTNTVVYGYLADSDLLHSTIHLGPTNDTAHIRHYEPTRDLVSLIENLHGTNTISSFDYTNDPGGRRTRRLDQSPTGTISTNTFGYNLRSELISAIMGSDTSSYAYDPIGNRTSATQFDGTHNYDANQLNQYTNITTIGTGSQTPTHDVDGNLLDVNSFAATWNGENRLT